MEKKAKAAPKGKAAKKAPLIESEVLESAPTTELATIEPETALAVFSADNGLDPYIEKIRAEVAEFVPDTTTKKGRDAIASMAYKVSQSKSYLDNAGKELVAELKAIPAKIDAERKRMRDTLDALRDSVRAPLNEWEAAEAARVADLQARVARFENAKSLAVACDSAVILREHLVTVSAIVVDESYQEYQAQAVVAKAAAVEALQKALAAREKYDAEQAELAKLRAEAAAREQADREALIAQQAAEAERQRAEREAQAERDAAAKREADAKAAAERRELELRLAAETAQREAAEAERRVLEAQQRAAEQAEQAAQAERDKHAQITAQALAELAAREKDRAHKKTINTQAVADFVAGGMTEDCAKQAVTLIARKAVRGIVINY